MQITGIDNRQKHYDIANWLAANVGVSNRAEAAIEDAETFLRPEAFEIVLHFSTLYHLENPLMSL
ncbi:MAG: hypothetical protein K9L82_03340 [Chromatiaceae bacterium]|nr:hypothetical protein [Chromatiaceae bacterium]MCF7993339.1 hypothetical protein [Chromatiaceae bacterium]MCF8014853.1 hypothetical protein [Chromatiaceae bacterium]